MPEAGPPAPQSSRPVCGPERTRAFHHQPRTRQWVPAEGGGGDLGRPAGSSDIRWGRSPSSRDGRELVLPRTGRASPEFCLPDATLDHPASTERTLPPSLSVLAGRRCVLSMCFYSKGSWEPGRGGGGSQPGRGGSPPAPARPGGLPGELCTCRGSQRAHASHWASCPSNDPR